MVVFAFTSAVLRLAHSARFVSNCCLSCLEANLFQLMYADVEKEILDFVKKLNIVLIQINICMFLCLRKMDYGRKRLKVKRRQI